MAITGWYIWYRKWFVSEKLSLFYQTFCPVPTPRSSLIESVIDEVGKFHQVATPEQGPWCTFKGIGLQRWQWVDFKSKKIRAEGLHEPWVIVPSQVFWVYVHNHRMHIHCRETCLALPKLFESAVSFSQRWSDGFSCGWTTRKSFAGR